MARGRGVLVVLSLLLALTLDARSVQAAPPEPVLDSALGEQVLTVPAAGLSEPELELTLFKPPGPGPFPVVLINHGRSPGDAKFQPRYRPVVAAREFVQRGYVLAVPMRQGFSRSGGREISGGCNVYSNGEQQARSVVRTLAWLDTQPWADVSRNIVVGQSHGGLTTLAYGMHPHPGTRLLVNFAGGLRQENCPAWEHNLIKAYAAYGEQTRLRSLWFYGDNDSYFQPWLFHEAHQKYTQAGGPAALIAFGAFKRDAHAMFSSPDGVPIWREPVLQAMAEQGLPTEVVVTLPPGPADIAMPPASDFAGVDDVVAVPLRSDRAREGYRTWLRQPTPRAFAIQPDSGAWGSAWGGATPRARALASCEKQGRGSCRLYAVDEEVVWVPGATLPDPASPSAP